MSETGEDDIQRFNDGAGHRPARHGVPRIPRRRRLPLTEPTVATTTVDGASQSLPVGR
jgi:hypothetical protein